MYTVHCIVSGDANDVPSLDKRVAYGLWSDLMTDAQLDKYPGSRLHPHFVTYGHPSNSYNFEPKRIDFLMYWASPEIVMCTKTFDLPHYITPRGSISQSDHEALRAEFIIERRGNEIRCEKDRSYGKPKTNIKACSKR